MARPSVGGGMTYEELEQRNAELQWRLDGLLGTGLLCPVSELKGKKFALTNLLAARSPNLVTYEACLFAMYEEPHETDIKQNTIKVFIHNTRKALKPFGVKIETIYGRGYRMPIESKIKWQAMVDAANHTEEAA